MCFAFEASELDMGNDCTRMMEKLRERLGQIEDKKTAGVIIMDMFGKLQQKGHTIPDRLAAIFSDAIFNHAQISAVCERGSSVEDRQDYQWGAMTAATVLGVADKSMEVDTLDHVIDTMDSETMDADTMKKSDKTASKRQQENEEENEEEG